MLVPKKYKRTGLLGLGEHPPTQVTGVIQRVAYDPPERCDKCGGRDISTDPMDLRRYSCFQCGQDFFLVEAPWRRVTHARMAP